jgi:hypothetical protein
VSLRQSILGCVRILAGIDRLSRVGAEIIIREDF